MQNNQELSYQRSLNTNNISKTGYRALFLLLKLLEKPMSREEVLECFSQDNLLNNCLSKDTVTNTVNALKNAGCIISRPTKRTNQKYILKSHPFSISLNKENVKALQTIRENIISLGDWKLLINLNNLYTKIAHLAPDEESQKTLLYNHPLKNVDNTILNELLISITIKKNVILSYNSPAENEELLNFSPQFITLENGKLYVWGYNKKYNDISFLRVDRIKKINCINFLGNNTEAEEFKKNKTVVIYKLRGISAALYLEEDNETIIEKNQKEEYSLTIKSIVENQFNFLQKIISYGPDCILISPDSIKENFSIALEKTILGYKND